MASVNGMNVMSYIDKMCDNQKYTNKVLEKMRDEQKYTNEVLDKMNISLNHQNNINNINFACMLLLFIFTIYNFINSFV